MRLQGKIIVVTGGASGIGLAMAKRFIAAGAIVIISDINEKALEQEAQQISATPIVADVSKEEEVKELVEKATMLFGRIDVFVSNAGVARFGDVGASEEAWAFAWHVNVMSQVYAAKYVLPQMLERGEGYLVNTASAAGLLMEFHSVLYSTTKHASIGLSEWLAATYRESGIKVTVVCPGPVRTPMAAGVAAMQEDVLEPEQLADMVVSGIEEEKFMICSHEKIWKLFQVKGQDYERYIDLMVERRAYKLGLDEKQQPL